MLNQIFLAIPCNCASWIWSDGTSRDYVHWGPSEPNNGKGGTEDYLQNNRYASGGLATWNDAPLNASYMRVIFASTD